MRQLMIHRADGGISLSLLKDGDEAQEVFDTWTQSAAASWLPAAFDVNDPPLPQPDRHFRNAWAVVGGVPVVDMPRARDYHMARIREVRDAELVKKDIEFTKAQGAKDQAQTDKVEAERQTLRDLPATFDLTVATTPNALKALWPAGLPES